MTNYDRDPRPVDPPLPRCSTCGRRFEAGDVAIADLFDNLHCVECSDDDDFVGGAV